MSNIRLLLSLTALPLLGCSSGFLFDRADEGVIEYALSFPDQDPNSLMADMLPERSLLTFADGKQVVELSAGMGMFRTSVVSNNTTHAMEYHMSMMSKRLVAQMLPSDVELIQEGGKPTILHTGHVDTIAGYPCHRAVAIFDRIEHPEIELWYTDQIDLADPNWFSPFAEIPGVLLRYEVVQYGLRMRLNAVSVRPGKVDPAKFVVSPDHERVAPEVLHSNMLEVLNTFSM